MTEGSGKGVECPGCGYLTVLFEEKPEGTLCPECGANALVTPSDAKRVRLNRMPDDERDDRLNGDFTRAPGGESGSTPDSVGSAKVIVPNDISIDFEGSTEGYTKAVKKRFVLSEDEDEDDD